MIYYSFKAAYAATSYFMGGRRSGRNALGTVIFGEGQSRPLGDTAVSQTRTSNIIYPAGLKVSEW